MKATLIVVGLFGTILYAFFLAATFADRTWIERVGTEYIDFQVQRRVDQAIDSVQPPSGDSLLQRAARKLYQENEENIERLKASLKVQAQTRFADAISQMRDVSCECREYLEERVADTLDLSIETLRSANDQIALVIQKSYASVIQQLKRDFRIFSSANLLAFLVLLLTVTSKKKAMAHLVLPGAMLALSAMLCSYFYLFQQDWLMTIVHGSYVGYWYFVWLGVVFLFLLDVVINRGRVTTKIINGILNALGSAFSVAPC